MGLNTRPYEISLWDEALAYVIEVTRSKETDGVIQYLILANAYTESTDASGITSITIDDNVTTIECFNLDENNLKKSFPFGWKIKGSRLKERKLGVIGSNTMTAGYKAFNGKLVSNVNGSNTLTFSTHLNYRDVETGEKITNPFITMLANERRVKLRIGEPTDPDVEWYEFVIKNIQESSDSKVCSYTCTDLFLNELSRTGYNTTLDGDLENNIGTPTELATRALTNTDWRVLEPDDPIHTFYEEPVYKIRFWTGENWTLTPVVKKSSDSNTYTLTGDFTVYAFYSCVQSQNSDLQVLCKVDANGKPKKVGYDEEWVLDDTGAVIASEHIEKSGVRQFLISGITYEEDTGEPNNSAIINCNLSTLLRGRRIVRSQVTKFDSNLKKYVARYYPKGGNKDDIYWAFGDTSKESLTVLHNYVTNSKDFMNIQGWEIASDDVDNLPTINFTTNYNSYAVMNSDGSFKVNDGSLVESKLELGNLKNKPVANTGLYDYLYDYKKINKGDVFIIAIDSYPGDGFYAQINLYDKKWGTPVKTIKAGVVSHPNRLTTEQQEEYNAKWSGYSYLKQFTFDEDLSHDDLINNELRLCFYGSGGTYTFDKIYLFKRVYIDANNEIVDAAEDAVDILFPGEYSETPIVFTEYHLYKDGASEDKDIDSMTYLLNTKNKSDIDDNYLPYYDPKSEARVQVNAKESNSFNILQDIAEAAQCWVKFSIAHNNNTGETLSDEDGLIKQVQYQQFVGKDNFAGFKYGINLKSISRTIESNQLTTKLIVKPNSNEFADGKQCSIEKAPSNPTKENIIYNLDYFVNQNMLPKSDVMNDFYAQDTAENREKNYICYHARMRKLTDDIAEKAEQQSYYALLVDKLEAEVTTYSEARDSAATTRNEAVNEIWQRTKKYTYSDYVGLVSSLYNKGTIKSKTIQAAYDYYNGLSEDKIAVGSKESHFIEDFIHERLEKVQQLTQQYDNFVSALGGEIVSIPALPASVKLNSDYTIASGSEALSTSKFYYYKETPTSDTHYYYYKGKQWGHEKCMTTGFEKVKDDNGNYFINKKNVYLLSEHGVYVYYSKTPKDGNLTWRSNTSIIAVQSDLQYKSLQIDFAAAKEQYQNIRNTLADKKEAKAELEAELYKRYSRFIQEGTWISEDYYDNELYYLDACNVSYTSAFPQVSYTINVVDVSREDGFENIKFSVGDKTYIQDTEFFGYVMKDDNIETPYKEEVVCSEISYSLDDPTQNSIKVQNYKNQFEDLFQRIQATTQQVQYKAGEYQRAANSFDEQGQLQSSTLKSALERNKSILANATNESVTWDNTGITSINLNSPNLMTRIVGGAMMVTNDGGVTWGHAITGEGINANYLAAGVLDVETINIRAGEGIPFNWDKKGITAYASQYFDGNGTIVDYESYNNSTFVRFDQFGIYGIKNNRKFKAENISDVEKNASFGLTWNGFFLKTGENASNKTGVFISSKDDIEVKQDGNTKIKIGRLSDGATEYYGIKMGKNINGTESGDVALTLNADGTITLGKYDSRFDKVDDAFDLIDTKMSTEVIVIAEYDEDAAEADKLDKNSFYYTEPNYYYYNNTSKEWTYSTSMGIMFSNREDLENQEVVYYFVNKKQYRYYRNGWQSFTGDSDAVGVMDIAWKLGYASYNYARSQMSIIDNEVNNYLTAGGQTAISGKYVISPYIGGGYLYIANGDKKVIIDPSNKTKTGYIFQVHNGTEISLGIDAKGNAVFAGEITAKSGKIGNWTIDDHRIYAGDGVNVKTAVVQAPTASAQWVFAAGGSSNSSYQDCPFRVHKDGRLFATAGEIGGWSLGKYTLIGDNVGITSQPGNGWAFWAGPYTGDDPGGNSPFKVGHEGAVYASKIHITGGDITVGSNFSVSSSGVLTAANAVINGKITAATGKIGALQIIDEKVGLTISENYQCVSIGGPNHMDDRPVKPSYAISSYDYELKDEDGYHPCNFYVTLDGLVGCRQIVNPQGGARNHDNDGYVTINHLISGDIYVYDEGYIDSNWAKGSYVSINDIYFSHYNDGSAMKTWICFGGLPTDTPARVVSYGGRLVLYSKNSAIYANGTADSNKILTGSGGTSSLNVKTNLQNINSKYEQIYKDIQQIGAYTFDYKYRQVENNNLHDYGFIIDEIENTIELSKYFKNYNTTKILKDNILYSIDEDEELQEQQQVIDVKTWDITSYIKGLFVMIKTLQYKIDQLEQKFENLSNL